MKRSSPGIVALYIMAALAVPSWAQEVGMNAPALAVGEWVKGEPVDLAKGKGEKVYVVEFWATWCGPCITSIPHLSAIQKKYGPKGVEVIGISSSDQDLEVVKKFVERMGDKMAYHVAWEDRAKRETSKAYMEAFKQNGIPHAFVIDKQGKIVWHGHPMAALEPVLEMVLSGDYTIEKIAQIEEEIAKKQRAIGNTVRAYFELLQQENPEGLDQAARKVWEAIHEDAQFLNEVSWNILTAEDLKHRDLKFALKLAERADELTKGEDADIVDTLARALFENGNLDAAIKHQKRAVELAKGDERREAAFRKVLEEYEAKAKERS